MTQSVVCPIWEEVGDSANTEKSNGLSDCVKNGILSFLKDL
jgi:hypothetical protein